MKLSYGYVNLELSKGVTELRGQNVKQALHVLECLIGRDFTDFYKVQDNSRGKTLDNLPDKAILKYEKNVYQGSASRNTVSVNYDDDKIAFVTVEGEDVRVTSYSDTVEYSALDTVDDNLVGARVQEHIKSMGYQPEVVRGTLLDIFLNVVELLHQCKITSVIVIRPFLDDKEDMVKLCKICKDYGNFVIFTNEGADNNMRLEASDGINIKYI